LPDYLINSGASGAETQMWGVGIVQEIDSAAMSMWLSYRHIDGSVDCIAGAAGDDCRLLEFDNLEDFQYVKFGALVNF